MESPTKPSADQADEVLRLGDPRLRWPSKAVTNARAAPVRVALGQLHDTLAAFRAQYGFGRAIAAPQIGIRQRLVAFDLGKGQLAMINPRIVKSSKETFRLWDDCLCFPDLLVCLRRACSITIEFDDERGHAQCLSDLPPAESELFQHELDHLDGILAVDRALDPESIVTRAEFERDPERFKARLTSDG